MVYDIVTCGSATVDVFADTDNELIEIKTHDSQESLIAYPSGCKMLINKLNFEIGGGGTNTAVGFSRMNLKVGYIGGLGDDQSAERIKSLLKKEKIEYVGHTNHHQTGYSIILDSIEHDRTILTYKGANDFLDDKKIPKKAFATKWIYFASMMGKSFATQKKIAAYSAKHNINIAYNPSEYQTKKGCVYLKPILQHTTILILNKEEAECLAGFGKAEEIIMRLRELGPKIACITDGGKAVYVCDGEYMYIAKPPKVKVVESTGAGDAFASGFVSSIIKDNNIDKAIRIGTANAQSVLLHHGAKNKLLSYNQAISKAKSARISITKKKVQ